MRDFTIVPNAILHESQLSMPARYLLCVLLRYCGKSEYCFPSQKTLAKDLGCTDRYVRDLLKELEDERLISKERRGYNRSNTYKVAKDTITTRNPVSSLNDGNTPKNRNSNSSHLGTMLPIHQGSTVPPNSTYLKGKDNNTFSHKGLEKLRKTLVEKGIMPNKPLRLKPLT